MILPESESKFYFKEGIYFYLFIGFIQQNLDFFM